MSQSVHEAHFSRALGLVFVYASEHVDFYV